MSNLLVIWIYMPCALISTAILVVELLRRFKRHEDYLFSMLCFCNICWLTTNMTGLLVSNTEIVKFCINFPLVFVGFVPPLLLLFTLRFYKVAYQPSRLALGLLFVIPIINTGVAITSGVHTLMNLQLDIFALKPLREVFLVWGPWFWVHTSFCYIISILLICIIIFQHFRLPLFYRLPSRLMIIGVSITLVGNVITLMEVLPQAIDLTLITMSFSLILFNLAIINNNKSKFARFSHGQIYNHLNLYILILNERQKIVDYNRPALSWFSSHDIILDGAHINNITEALLRKKDNIKKPLLNESGTDYYIYSYGFPVVINLCIYELADAKGDNIGSIAVFTDVTQNRMLIKRLEEKAGMDSLTGIPNHMAYEGAKKRLDIKENLPLSVIMCDANELKNTNDKHGHQYGDMLLRVIAEILEKACPKLSFVARIGGDEFIYLLPCFRPEESCVLMSQIKEELLNFEKLPFTVSVAMGTATKYSVNENLDDVIALADSRMYQDKRRWKGLE